MTRVFECFACGGSYGELCPDGSPYFHACSSVANPAHQPDPRRPAYDPREAVERAGHRDENRLPTDQRDAEGRLVVSRTTAARAEGAGRRRLA